MKILSHDGKNPANPLKKKVLLFGIDGVQFQRLAPANLPNFRRLTLQRAYTGGVFGQISEQDTWSGPGWATLLTGVWASRHQITGNGSGHADSNYPSVFARIRQAMPSAITASYISWSPIMDTFFSTEKPLISDAVSQLSDAQVTERVVSLLNTGVGADFLFAQLSDPDNAGHSHGYGPEYDAAMTAADSRLGQVLDAVQERMALHEEDWLVIVSTDHGRSANGYGHGGHSELEKTIFIGVLDGTPFNEGFHKPVTDMENQAFSGLYGCPSQASVAPTILRHLGVSVQDAMGLEGIPLIGELGVRALMLSADTNALVWSCQSTQDVHIVGTGATDVRVPANIGRWTMPISHIPETAYRLSVGPSSTSCSVHVHLRDVKGALDWSQARAFIFFNDLFYSRYNTAQDHADDGYPAPFTASSWPGLQGLTQKVTGGVSKDERIAFMFLDDATYVRYNKVNDRVDDGYPKAINDSTWPGMGPYAALIQTAVRWPGDMMFFFLSDGTYLKFDLVKNSVDRSQNYPLSTARHFPGLAPFVSDMTACVKFSDRYAYFFLKGRRFLRYDIAADKVDEGYPQKVNNTTWPGLL